MARKVVGKTQAKRQTIPCTCDPEGRLERVDPSVLVPYQRDLKDLEEAAYAQLRQSLEQYGFTVPVFVWRQPDGALAVLDGHQRLRVLEREGWVVDGGIPVVTVEAADAQEAAGKLLVIASHYGRISRQGLYEFGAHHGLDLGSFRLAKLPEVDWQAFRAEFFRDGFVPNTDPSFGVSAHTDGSVERARDQLEGQFAHEPQQHSVMCPYCSKEFFVDD